MKILEGESVKKADGSEWTFNMPVPESLEEAIDLYSADKVFELMTAALKVRLQAVARNGFAGGDDVAKVEQALSDWRPGATSRTSYKSRAVELIMSMSDEINNDAELKGKVLEAFTKSQFKEVVRILAPNEVTDEPSDGEE